MGDNPIENAPSIKTDAWMAALKVDYNIDKRFGIGIGSDYLSGRNMNSTSANVTYFNPLYGTHHKFYGFMDYFYVSSPHRNVGLWDSYLNLKVNSTEKLSWQVALHHFEAAAKVIDYSGNMVGSTLGNEADLTFGYNLMKDVKLTGGYSQMFTASSMKYVKNILPPQNMKPVQNWIWLSINITPEIIVSKSK